VFEVVEGDTRNVLCDAVERHDAELLVVGSHGYGEGGRVQCHRKKQANQCSILPRDFETGWFRFCLRSVLNLHFFVGEIHDVFEQDFQKWMMLQVRQVIR
jgi:hypothetical protein